MFHLLLTQAQQPQKFPWGFLLFGLFAVAAVGLLVYFLTRVRKSEKEAEEDWGFSNRGILLTPVTVASSEVKKTSEPAPKTPAPLPEPEPPPIAATSETSQARPVAETPGRPDTKVVATTPPKPASIEAAEMMPLPAIQDTVFAPEHQEPVAAAEPQPHLADEGSPFDEEIWSELESPEPTTLARQSEIKSPVPGHTRPDQSAVRVSSHKDRYEPPRIDPIVPRAEKGERTPVPPRKISRTVSASQQAPANRARFESPALF